MALKVAKNPESFDRGGGNYLKEPGTYHMTVIDTNEQPSDKGGKLIDGFQVRLAVLAGTTTGQEKKEIELIFWNPKLNDSEEKQETAARKQNRFLEAVGLIDRHNVADEVELANAKNRQCIVSLEYKQKKNDATGEWQEDTSGLRVKFADTFHVDDPDAAGFPRNEAAIKLLPASMRRDASYWPKPSGNGSASNGKTPNGLANKSPVNMDDL